MRVSEQTASLAEQARLYFPTRLDQTRPRKSLYKWLPGQRTAWQRMVARPTTYQVDYEWVEPEPKTSGPRLHWAFSGLEEGVALHRLVYDECGMLVNYEILDSNSNFDRMLGLKRREVVHHLATDVYGAAEAPYLAEYAQAAESKLPHFFETYDARLSRRFCVSACCVDIGCFTAIFYDISDLT
ncbi:MAG: hypothetical protein M1434_00530 [Chloroflexi bacterium]|nr:hypothetical protein [Chloroflexota bacterium]MCL5273219.1 hypothetical protein [Chloroflexota bacterium]